MNAASRAVRWRRAGVRPLEVWNRPLRRGLFWERVGVPCVEAQERSGADERAIGEGLAVDAAEAIASLSSQYSADHVFVAGGLTALPGFRETLLIRVGTGFVHVDNDGSFAGERGGNAMLRERGYAEGAVIDVGQTGIKGSCRGVRRSWPRDLEALPRLFIDPEGRKPAPCQERLRRSVSFISSAIHELFEASESRDPSLVLALPCPIGDDLVPGACTYGWEAETRLLPAILASLDGPKSGREADVLVLNDAELAAESARVELAPKPGERVLVLTLGFGPGGALIEGVRA